MRTLYRLQNCDHTGTHHSKHISELAYRAIFFLRNIFRMMHDGRRSVNALDLGRCQGRNWLRVSKGQFDRICSSWWRSIYISVSLASG